MDKTTIGSLDRRITIQRATTVRNDYNEPIETWEDLVTVSARRRDASAGERYSAQEVGAEITTRFTIRYSSEVANVDPTYRIVFDGRTYNVTSVRDLGRNRWREIDAVARAEGVA